MFAILQMMLRANHTLVDRQCFVIVTPNINEGS